MQMIVVLWAFSGGQDFSIPQSRGRTYGISIKTNGGLDTVSQAALTKKLESAWEFVGRCKLKWTEPLFMLWERTRSHDCRDEVPEEPFICNFLQFGWYWCIVSTFLGLDHVLFLIFLGFRPCSCVQNSQEIDNKRKNKKKIEDEGTGKKWPSMHTKFKDQHGIDDADLCCKQLMWLKEQLQTLQLPKREVEGAMLTFAALRKQRQQVTWLSFNVFLKLIFLVGGLGKKEQWIRPGLPWTEDIVLKGVLYVCNIGDSITRMRWKTTHHCLLPRKRYLYLTEGTVFINPGKQFLFALQGLSPAELYGLQHRLSCTECQDLLGNAFTSNVIAAVALAALLFVLPGKWSRCIMYVCGLWIWRTEWNALQTLHIPGAVVKVHTLCRFFSEVWSCQCMKLFTVYC